MFLIKILYIILFLFYSNISLFSKSKWLRYKIKRGDNLTKIARKYKVTVGDIQYWNQLSTRNYIFAGKILKIRQKSRGRISNSPVFNYPTKKHRIIRYFRMRGRRKNPGVILKTIGRHHVFNSREGKVVETGVLRGYGRYLVIDHGRGWLSFYSHLSQINVSKNEWVRTGVKLGLALNKKLFFSISWQGRPLNPIKILERSKQIFEPS